MTGGVDTTVLAAFAVGFVSFISPCVLPLVPGYLSAVSGVSVAEMQQRRALALRRVLLPAIVFCLSFTVVFVALGMTATGLGSTLQDSRGTLDKVAGVVIIALGVFFLLTPFVPQLNREWRPEMLMSRARLGRAAGRRRRLRLRLDAVRRPDARLDPHRRLRPGHASARARSCCSSTRSGWRSRSCSPPSPSPAPRRRFRWLRDRYLIVTAVSGVVLIAMGVLLLTGELTRLNSEAQQALDSIGLNVFGDL